MKQLETAAVLSASIAVVLLLGLVVGMESQTAADETRGADTPSQATSSPATSTLVNLYYYNPQKDINDAGQLGCTDAGLTALPRRLPTGDNLPERTLEALFSGEITDDERAAGATTEFPLAGLSVVGVSVRSDGSAVVALDDPQNQTSGGACRANVLRAQVEETLRQFPDVAAVEFLPHSVFQP